MASARKKNNRTNPSEDKLTAGEIVPGGRKYKVIT